jgi:hypothetical protein
VRIDQPRSRRLLQLTAGQFLFWSGKKGPGRPRKVGRPANPTKGLVTQREAKRLVKAALAAYKAKLPKLIKKELRKLLK